MERRRLLGGMALLLLQALPSPLSARAEPPQVRGRERLGQAGGLGVVEAWLEGAEGMLSRVDGSQEGHPCLEWTGCKGASVFN